MDSAADIYPARLRIDYPEQLDRLTTLLRIFWAIPIFVILAIVAGGGGGTTVRDGAERVRDAGPGILFALAFATALMILFRQRYPRWWFDFQLALARFSYRVAAYFALLRDEYPSTEDEQAVHLDLDYPDVPRQLNRWLPLIKWLLAIPHFLVLILLSLFAVVAVIVAWFAILFTGRYPRGLFDYVVGVGRWALRVQAYAIFMLTDRYPPFSLS
ncbi:MAG: hypothetical protein A3G84_02075 [Chloroflexi bacterium RIFCSPLOWO2_12_FULL_71_12]|nr:MAG: hypothetical protein A2082_01055 [Chloroflexi bacterium GWC2_70_10]OGO70118.1 MAG: hypothetical protein A3H36_09680 [Chloroflexi bacterium RIFCSPLOWO2_02_FULL_71_16]OGO73468.1 MAG: hypothetical protein A3G84_02075 [Chloroflexi bacterium RIFCSPLOWO2_12_FULL_71_12]